MPWMNITCGFCRHEADIDAFTRTAVFGELPANVYQCPSCRRAIRRAVTGPGTRYDNGHYVPGPVALVDEPSRL